MIYLSKLLEGRSIEDKRYVLKRFYDDGYATGVYDPTNGLHTWKKLAIYPSEAKCLDVGCGTGAGIAYARKVGWQVYGCDLADASKSWKENGVDDYCVIADARALPYPDNEFDFVLCNDVLEHIPEEDVDSVLKEIARVSCGCAFLGIALFEERKPVKGMIYAHICLQPEEWWREKIGGAGFNKTHIANQEHHLAVWGFV